MGKTSKRRLRRMAQRYADILTNGGVEVFRLAWRKREQVWLDQIECCVKLHRQVRGSTSMTNDKIFDVLDAANRLIRECGNSVEDLVGNETRTILTNECAKAVARIYDRRLHQLVERKLYLRNGKPDRPR